MKKRVKINIPVIILTVVILIALSHITLSLIFSTSNTPNLTEGETRSITGKVSFSPGDAIDKYVSLSPGVRLIIAGEWLVVIIVIIIVLVRGKHKFSKETEEEKKVNKDLTTEKIKIKYHKSKPETDLDVLYKVLKEKKTLRVVTISEIFKINKDTAMNWCKILEEGNFATIRYPTVGSPKITVNETTEDEEKEEDTTKNKGKENKITEDKDKGKENKITEDKDKGKENKITEDKDKGK